ncbi:MAG: acetolactate synthase large subunit, partial [Candidatus Acidiferrales bacterium]
MNGAESLVRTLLASGVDTCFTNPGTSEMHIVAALDRAPAMRCALGLFEGVVTGAADGYARMSGKPACTLLHLGPGLANGLANLHNAHRARVPIVNLVGQHPLDHLPHDAPLTSDIEAIARPYSRWLRTSLSASALGRDAAEAVFASRTAPYRIATLIIPADAAWSEGGSVPEIPAVHNPPLPSTETVNRAATMLRSGARTGLILAGSALQGRGLTAAGRIAAATGAKLFSPYPFTRMERGAGLPRVERTQYVVEQALEQFKEFRQLILVGAPPPVAYFAYPDRSSILTARECELFALATSAEDCAGALESLVATLSIEKTTPLAEKPER